MKDLGKVKEKYKYPWWSWVLLTIVSAYSVYNLWQAILSAVNGRAVIHSDSSCQIVGHSFRGGDKKFIYYLTKGTYQIKSKQIPGQTCSLSTTGNAFDVLMPEGTCADVMDPRINPKNACLNCAQTFWSEGAPEP